jgi:methylmalonyl-CoA mutase cobalamin-binding subunit
MIYSRATALRSALGAAFCALLGLTMMAGAGEDQQPVLTIPGASDSEGLKISTHASEFSRPFFVESVNSRPVTALRIFIANLVGPDSQMVETRWTVNGQQGATASVSVPGLGSAEIEVSARLPKDGTYTGSISLIYNDKRWTIPLSVTRSPSVATVKILELPAARAASLWNADPKLWMTVEETGGLKWTLDAPQLTALALKESDKTRIQARFDRVEFLTDDAQAIGKSLAMGPNQARRVEIRINNLRDTGEYSGTIRVGATDFAPVEQAFTIFVKKHWSLAALLIFLGVFCSYLLKRYYKMDRPRLLLQHRLLKLSSDVESVGPHSKDLTKGENAVLDSFRNRLQDLYEDVAAGMDKDADVMLSEIDRKLSLFPMWMNARRRIDAVRPPEIVVTLRQKLADVESVMAQKGTSAQELDRVQQELVQLAGAITDAVRSDLVRRLNEFETEVDEQTKNSSAALASRLSSDVIPQIADAKRMANSNDFVGAQSKFDGARGVYAHVLAEELENRLASDPTPPGISQADWDKVVVSVSQHMAEARQATDPDQAIASYQAGYTIYLRKLIEALRERARNAVARVGAIGPITEDDKKLYQQRLGAIVQTLDSAIQKLQVRQLRNAATDYAAAKKEMEDIATKVKQAAPGSQMSTVPNDAIADVQAGGTIPVPARELPVEQMTERSAWIKNTVRELTNSMKRRDLIFTVVILLISVVLGLKLLWADDPTWGGWNAYLTAVLWGLGLHQVSGTAFEGAAGLVEKWSK